jgi:dCTP deaminase
MIQREMILAADRIQESQLQPASLDLRIGRQAYRIRASFLPGKSRTVREQLESLSPEPVDLSNGAVLEKGCVYLVELQELLNLQPTIFGIANPKSSTGRLDIFTRVIADRAERFDTVAGGYRGPLYAEISPRTFSIKVRKGSRLNQMRFRRRTSGQDEHSSFYLGDRQLRAKHEASPLVDGDLVLRDGVVLSVALSFTDAPEEIIGYRAQKHTSVIDVDRVGAYDWSDYWEPVYKSGDGKLILDPDQFYILASKERLHIPPDMAAEMVPIDPRMGEFRVHYAGFFDPGFGHGLARGQGARAVLEVRSREVAFILEHGQMVGRLVYEQMTEPTDALYGQLEGSSYQAQGLKLSKHFKPFSR